MRRIKRAKPSPALLVAVVALVAALGGGAVAGVAVTSLNKKETKKVRKIAKNQANKAVKGIPAGPKGDQGLAGPNGVTGGPGPKGEPGLPGPTEGVTGDSFSGQLTEQVALDQDSFTTTQAGRLLVIKPTSKLIVLCDQVSLGWRAWLQVDGEVVPGSSIDSLTSHVVQSGLTFAGVTASSVAAGEHTAEVAGKCSTGDLDVAGSNDDSGVSAVVLGG